MSLDMLTVTVADFDGSATLVAVTDALADAGKSPGAVYTPADVIVPDAAFPPDAPFTLQETAVFEVPVTVAANIWEFPSRMVWLVGETLTAIMGGGGGGVGPPDPLLCEQPGKPLPMPSAGSSHSKPFAHGNRARGVTDFSDFICARGRMPGLKAGEGPAKRMRVVPEAGASPGPRRSHISFL